MDQINDKLEHDLELAAGLVRMSKHLVAFVGAGMSVESGIPPFRGPGGLWTQHGQPTSLSYQRFLEDPVDWWEQRMKDEVEPGNTTYQLKTAVDAASPNRGHYCLRELENLGFLKYIITQNVDNLQTEAGSVRVAEIHGNRTKLRCVQCGVRRPRERYPVVEIPPRCPECAGLLKIDSVMFGEPIPPDVMSTCVDQTEKCDRMLVIGTSGTVQPAARLPMAAKSRGAVLIEINPHETSLTHLADVVLNGPSAEILPLLMDRVREGPWA